MEQHSAEQLIRDHRAGIVLFQAGEFWEAHEAWEQCWRAVPEPERTHYKGLIQAAAALEQWRRGNLRGLERNWAKARPRLLAAPAQWRGIDVGALIVSMDRFVGGSTQSVAPRLTFDASASVESAT
jgi:hypothetical protein